MRRFVFIFGMLLCAAAVPPAAGQSSVVKIHPRTEGPYKGLASTDVNAANTLGIPACGTLRKRFFYAVLTGLGTQTNAVTWTGTLSTVATYTATGNNGLTITPPSSVPSPAVRTIIATATFDSHAETLNVRIIPCLDSGDSNQGGAQLNFPTTNPASAQLYPGEQLTVTLNATGGTNNTVTWYVGSIGGADVAGGNATFGTIVASGGGACPAGVCTAVFTAPATRPADSGDGMVRLTAISTDDALAKATGSVTLLKTRYFTVYPPTLSILPGYSFPFGEQHNVYKGVTGTTRHNKIATGSYFDPLFYPAPLVGTVSSMGLRYTAPVAQGADSFFIGSTVDQWTGKSVTRTANTDTSTVTGTNLLTGDNIILTACSDTTFNKFFTGVTVSGSTVTWTDNQGNSSATGCTISRAATSAITVTVPATNQFGLLTSAQKVRPYDIVAPASSFICYVLKGEYCDVQIVIRAAATDFSGVSFSLGQLTDGAGHTIDTRLSSCISSVATGCPAELDYEFPMNIAVLSRAQGGVIGEYPDIFVPVVDNLPGVHEKRCIARHTVSEYQAAAGNCNSGANSNKFNVNRVSPAYKIYPGGSGQNIGNVLPVSGGTTTLTDRFRVYRAVVDAAGTGAIGSATVRVDHSDNFGSSWTVDLNTQATTACPTAPAWNEDGSYLCFVAGGTAVADLKLNDEIRWYAAPFRNEVFYLRIHASTAEVAGTYSADTTNPGSHFIRITGTGFAAQDLDFTLVVKNVAGNVTSPLASIVRFNDSDGGCYTAGTLGTAFGFSGCSTLGGAGPNLDKRYQAYFDSFWFGAMGSNGNFPSLTFNNATDGTVATQNFSAYNSAVNPHLQGSSSYAPFSEAAPPLSDYIMYQNNPGTKNTLTFLGGETSEMVNGLMAEDTNAVTSGVQASNGLYACDEPHAQSEWVICMEALALLHQAGLNNGHTLRGYAPSLVIMSVNDAGQADGFNDYPMPTVSDTDSRNEWETPFGNPTARANLDPAAMAGAAAGILSYIACGSTGCGTGLGTFGYELDRLPTNAVDQLRDGLRPYFTAFSVPYRIFGWLHYSSAPYYAYGNGTTLVDIDTFDAVFSFSANGDGSWTGPGRVSTTVPANYPNAIIIGGTTPIPLATFRVVQVYNGLQDASHAKTLIALGGAQAITANQQVLGCVENNYIYDGNPGCWQTLHDTLLAALASAPSATGCLIVSGNVVISGNTQSLCQ